MAERFKICIVMGSHWTRQMGGSQYQAKCILDALLADGRWDVHYVASMVDGGFEPVGYTIHAIGKQEGLRRFGGLLWDAPSLRRTLDSIHPDLVYQRGSKAYTGLVARFCQRQTCPFVFHIAHDDDVRLLSTVPLLRHSINKLIDKRLGDYGIRHARAVIAQTEYQSGLLLQNFGMPADLIAPNFHPLPDDPVDKMIGATRVVWVANFKRSKRPELFVDLAESMSECPDIRFVMIGRSGNPTLYEGLHRRIDSLPNLEYRGELPISAVNEELSRSHLFVSTSSIEGFPNTFIQAWMRRVPVLSMDVDPDNVLRDQGVGVICHDIQEMRQQVARLAKDNAARQRIGELAQNWAVSKHGPANASRIVDYLAQLASRRAVS